MDKHDLKKNIKTLQPDSCQIDFLQQWHLFNNEDDNYTNPALPALLLLFRLTELLSRNFIQRI